MEITYYKKTKSRKKCAACGRLIQDGEQAVMEKIITEKFYPVKGIMRFKKWLFRHRECK